MSVGGAIKPIPTYYHDTVFRSRTEARWSVFLDGIGIKWQYEVEGWELQSGRYLPDFWLPEDELWIEVKRDSLPDDEFAKAWHRAGELWLASGSRVVVVEGMPPGVQAVTWGCPTASPEICSECYASWEACEEQGRRLALFWPGGVGLLPIRGDETWDDDIQDVDGDSRAFLLERYGSEEALERAARRRDHAIAKAKGYDFSQIPFPSDVTWRRSHA